MSSASAWALAARLASEERLMRTGKSVWGPLLTLAASMVMDFRNSQLLLNQLSPAALTSTGAVWVTPSAINTILIANLLIRATPNPGISPFHS